jgi:hypothetical protein
MAYTNGAVATTDGIHLWGGFRWKGGISRKSRCGQTAANLSSESDSDDDMVSSASASEHAPRRLQWRGVAKGYEAENLILGHCHALIIARKT